MNKMLPLSFKGDRKYLQGGDIYNAVSNIAAELIGVPGAFVEWIAFRRFARMSCEVSIEPPIEQSQIVSQARVRAPGTGSLDVWLVETTIPVTSRRPFDEAQLLAKASLGPDGRSASLPERSVYSPIEDVIALTKHLNYAVSPVVNGKWVFGQLDLAEPLSGDYRRLKIRLKQMIGGRFSVNEIIVDGHNIGTISFIVGDP